MADIHILVADDSAGQRLDAYLGANDGCPTRSACAHLIEGGAVAVNGETCLSKKYAVRAGDRISVDLPEPHDPTDVIPEAIPLDIRYEDDYLIVLSKQRGLVCHPAHGHESGTLANALVYHCGIDHLGTVQGEDRARPLKRYLQKYVETLTARKILSGEVHTGDTLVLDVENGEYVVKVK